MLAWCLQSDRFMNAYETETIRNLQGAYESALDNLEIALESGIVGTRLDAFEADVDATLYVLVCAMRAQKGEK